MNNSSRCCDKRSMSDLALFGALVAAPTLLGLNRGIRALTTAFAIGKLATSMVNRRLQSQQHQEFSRPNRQREPQQSQQHRPEAAPAPQPPHHTPSKGGLDHIEGAASGPMAGAHGTIIR